MSAPLPSWLSLPCSRNSFAPPHMPNLRHPALPFGAVPLPRTVQAGGGQAWLHRCARVCCPPEPAHTCASHGGGKSGEAGLRPAAAVFRRLPPGCVRLPSGGMRLTLGLHAPAAGPHYLSAFNCASGRPGLYTRPTLGSGWLEFKLELATPPPDPLAPPLYNTPLRIVNLQREAVAAPTCPAVLGLAAFDATACGCAHWVRFGKPGAPGDRQWVVERAGGGLVRIRTQVSLSSGRARRAGECVQLLGGLAKLHQRQPIHNPCRRRRSGWGAHASWASPRTARRPRQRWRCMLATTPRAQLHGV